MAVCINSMKLRLNHLYRHRPITPRAYTTLYSATTFWRDTQDDDRLSQTNNIIVHGTGPRFVYDQDTPSHSGRIIPVLVHDGFIKQLCDDGSGNSPHASGERENKRGTGEIKEGGECEETGGMSLDYTGPNPGNKPSTVDEGKIRETIYPIHAYACMCTWLL